MTQKSAKNGYLSPNFKLSEFLSKDGNNSGFKINSKVIDGLETLRSLAGNKPITIDSAYRSPERNAKVGGVDNSQHTQGNAVDIKIPGLTVNQMAALARKAGFTGIGLYPSQGFIHVDVSKKREWTK